jgi:acetyltransferase-like isoleucine patch superfamily enzyme
MEGKAYVDGKLACEATLTCAVVPGRQREAADGRAGVSEHASKRSDRRGRGGAGVLHVGPFCTIGPEVVLGEDCTLVSHVVLDGRTRIGARNTIYPFTSIGIAPQDLKYHGEPTETIGDDNTIRECVTVSRGTTKGGGIDPHWLELPDYGLCACGPRQPGGQPLHPGQRGDAGGHVTIEDYATVGAFSPVHQFCTVGAMRTSAAERL